MSDQAGETNVLRVTGSVIIDVDMPLSFGEGGDEVASPEEALNWVLSRLCDLNCGAQDSSVIENLTVTEETW